MGRIFGTDGIRDRAGQGYLTPEFIERTARAVGVLLRKSPARFRTPLPGPLRHLRPGRGTGAPARGRVLIGRDTRASGPGIEQALARGFQAEGLGTALVGVATTPGVACLARAWGASLGVVISASHNPAEDNGIKFFSPQGFKIPDAAEDRIEKLLEKEAAPAGARKKALQPLDLSASAGAYLDFLAGFCKPLKGMKIVIDCGHGASSALAGPLFERLGARPIVLNASPDGLNINAGCGALHPEGVAEAVRREKAQLGVAYDGDADRAILIDEGGRVRDGDDVLALCATHLKERKKLPRNTVVSTVMANFGLERYLAGIGAALTRTPVGDKYVAEEMIRSGAVLGGEPAGHILFFDASTAGDGLLTTLRVLDVLAERGEPLSRLALAKCPQVLINVRVGRKPALDTVPGVQKALEAARRSLGSDGRVLVRYSGTENLCRVMVEGTDAALVDRLARDTADAVKKELA
jgi:phosphoglucosamine mutase